MTRKDELTAEERDILEAYETENPESVATPELRRSLADTAHETFRKNRRVNIRISGNDLDRLQERALIEGIPYQTLMSSVLHKFVNGRLIDRGSDPTDQS